LTDDELIESWLHDRPHNTQDGYRRDIRQFRKLIGKSLTTTTLEDIQRFSTYLQQADLKETTRRRKLNAVKSLFSFATRQAHTPANIAAAIRLPKTHHNLAGRILKRDETLRLIESGTTERDRLFLLLMYAIGARVSEMCALDWENFSEQSSGKIQVTIQGKGEKMRTVLVPLSVWVKLQSLQGESRLFPFTRQEAHSIIKEAVKRAGLNPKISCHWLRHCHARHAIEGGAKIQIVRDSLGHSSISVTNAYLESFPDESSSDFLAL
jgi:integrase/recombinase XerD